MQNSSRILDLHLFADDSNLFYADKSLPTLESTVNQELAKVHDLLCANKLSLNIEKSSFVILHPPQKKLDYEVTITLMDKVPQHEQKFTYLGVIFDLHLNWKAHISYLVKKLNRNIGALCKLRHFVNINILVNLYYSLIDPFFTYGIITWGNTYNYTINPLFALQKKAIRIITFSNNNKHTNPIYTKLKTLKLYDVIYFHNALFMYDYHSANLPSISDSSFIKVSQRHNYNTRLALKSSFSLPQIRTNYGKLNIRFTGPKVWNSVDEKTKILSKSMFKKELKNCLLESYK